MTKSIPVGTVVTAGTGKPGSSQIQFYRQPIRQQVKLMHANTGQMGTVVQAGQTALVGHGGIVANLQGIQGQTVQVQGGQKVAVASGSAGTASAVATVQMATGQRAQIVKSLSGKQIARQIGDGEMPTVMVKRPMISHKQAQIFTSNVQVQPGGSNQPQVATLVKTSGGLTSAVPLTQVKATQLKTAQVQVQNQVRQIQFNQPILTQQRKGGKVTQITQLSKTTLPTQLIVHNSKNIPGTVTVQQIQPVIRHGNQTQLTAGQIMLGKNVSRMIPVSVAQQPNQRQTIQVVTGTPPNVRAHVATSQNFPGVIQGIKVNAPQQQAILTALQNTNQRTNAARLQSGGSLVAVTVQQSPTSSQANPTAAPISDIQGGPQGTPNVQQPGPNQHVAPK